MDRKIYLDNASTTYVSSEVLNEMVPYFSGLYGNCKDNHSFGRDARMMVERAREKVAKAINSRTDEIYFTSGATEANNWAIKGIAHANKHNGRHIIVSKIEQPSILASCRQLEKEGFEITYIGCDNDGVVSARELIHYLRKDTILVSVMAANNEVGTIQNIKTLASIAHDKGAIFHTDATQAIGFVKIDVDDMGIDAMSISSHKIHGPKGAGALYLKNGIEIENLIVGDDEEQGKRSGSVDVPNVIGFGKAVEVAIRDLVVNNQKLKNIRDYFVRQLFSKLEYVKLNGSMFQRVSNIANISFEMINAESLATLLDLNGVCASICSANCVDTSYVLKAMNVEDSMLYGAVRFSFDKSLSKLDMDNVIEVIVSCVSTLRSMSPITKTGRAK